MIIYDGKTRLRVLRDEILPQYERVGFISERMWEHYVNIISKIINEMEVNDYNEFIKTFHVTELVERLNALREDPYEDY